MEWDRNWDSHPWDLWECHFYVINTEEEHARVAREERLACRRVIRRAKRAIQRVTGEWVDFETAREYISYQRWFGLGAPAEDWWTIYQRDRQKVASSPRPSDWVTPPTPRRPRSPRR